MFPSWSWCAWRGEILYGVKGENLQTQMMELLDQDTIDEALKGPGLAGGLADPGFESDMMSDDHSMPSHQWFLEVRR